MTRVKIGIGLAVAYSIFPILHALGTGGGRGDIWLCH